MIWVFTHRDCPDGTGAAYAAWTVFGREARYQPISHGDDHAATLSAVQPGDQVYVAEICFPYEVLSTLNRCQQVTILDHHVTSSPIITRARDTLGMDAHYDASRSGCMMAWDYFHPGRPAPRLLKHIQDQDLWRFKLDKTLEVMAGLNLHGDDLEEWDRLATVDARFDTLISEGEVLLRSRQISIERLMKNVRTVTIAGFRVPAINHSGQASHVCHAMLDRYPEVPFVAAYYDVEGVRHWSLRSLASGAKVSEVAQLFGGGGHDRAAGFTQALPDIVVEGLADKSKN